MRNKRDEVWCILLVFIDWRDGEINGGVSAAVFEYACEGGFVPNND